MTGSVIVFAGPSGGHLFPAVAFAEVLRSLYPKTKIYLVTGRKGKRLISTIPEGIFEKLYRVSDFPASPLRSWKGIWFLLQLLRAFGEVFALMWKLKPVLSVGFGSYVSFPGIVCSSWLRVPALIHEQNLSPGKATSWLVRYADCVATSFPEPIAPVSSGRHRVTGFPLRKNLVQAAATAKSTSFEPFSPEKSFRILVTGGSQGARSLNMLALDAFSHMSSEEKREIAVIHITGNADSERVKAAYARNEITATVYPFFDKMEALYEQADVAVTRAGAATLFELALFGVPAVVVPYPYAGNHQMMNARFFASRDAVHCYAERELTGGRLYEILQTLKGKPEARQNMKRALKTLQTPDASYRLVEAAVDCYTGTAKKRGDGRSVA